MGRGFALLWIGQSASLVGDQLTRLALPLAAVVALDASVGQVAWLSAAQQVPFLVLALPAGVWVGRFGLRRAMLASDIVRGVAVLSIPLAAAFIEIGVPYLVVASLVIGAAAVPFQLAYQSVVPTLVDPGQVPAANRRLTLSESAAGLLGPGAAGALVGLVGALRVLYFDAATYLISAVTLAVMRTRRPATVVTGSLWQQVRSGISYVRHSPPLRALVVASALFNVGFAGYEALVAVFAVRSLGMSPVQLGLAVGAGGIAVPLGVLLSRTAEHRWGRGPTLVIAAAFSAAGPFVVAGAPPAAGPVFLAAGTFLTGIGGGCWGVAALTTRQLLSRDDMRVQTTATHRFVSLGVLPVGAGSAGALAELAGTRTAMLAFAVLGATCVLPLLRVPMRDYTAPVSTPTPQPVP